MKQEQSAFQFLSDDDLLALPDDERMSYLFRAQKVLEETRQKLARQVAVHFQANKS